MLLPLCSLNKTRRTESNAPPWLTTTLSSVCAYGETRVHQLQGEWSGGMKRAGLVTQNGHEALLGVNKTGNTYSSLEAMAITSEVENCY